MKRRSAFVLALLLLLVTALCVPGTAYARDELKNLDPEKYYIVLDLNNQVVTVYERDDFGEYTRVVRRFLCSTGRMTEDEEDPEKEATPTPRGIWKMGGRERFGKFANFAGQYARYWTQIVGSIFFHSLMYNRRDNNHLLRPAYGAMGTPVSHGCVRLYVEDARWLYYYACPGTTVEVTRDIPKDRAHTKALRSDMSFSRYNAFQKTIVDGEELPNKRAWVTVKGARLRRGSGATFSSIKLLEVGEALEVLMEGEVWVKVRAGKSEGYVKRGYISYLQDAMDTTETATLVGTTQWIYSSPELTAEHRICKVPAQTSVKALEFNETEGWYKIQYRNEVGYIAKKHITHGWGELMN